jgi:hypothetical protein
MVANASTEGLEFVRAWDSLAVSLISLIPFGLSLLFAGVWIGVSIRQYGTDAQVATQTAFTVAAYIVTAGKFWLDRMYFNMLMVFCRCAADRTIRLPVQPSSK